MGADRFHVDLLRRDALVLSSYDADG